MARLERALDAFNADLPPLKDFILPGGSRAAALAHVARTVCRRAERRLVTLSRKQKAAPPLAVRYLNRLSDLLFVLARVLNRAAGAADVLWQQGKNRVRTSTARQADGSPDAWPRGWRSCWPRRAQKPARLRATCTSLTSAKLYGVALRILRRQDWAEEVLQECYVSIWNHAGDYAVQKSAPLTWMTSIVRNRCLDWLRRPQQEATGEEYDIAVEAWQDDAPGPLEQPCRRRATRRRWRAACSSSKASSARASCSRSSTA